MTSPVSIFSKAKGARPGRVAGAVLIALLFAYIFIQGGYLVTVMQLAMIYGIFCIGLNFFMGYTGQASFGQNAFAAIGGYGSAILCVQYHWEPILALIVSMGVAGLAALVVGYPTLRLRGHYLAMATFALGFITYDISVQWTSLTQGYMGYSGIPPLGIGPFTVESDRWKLVYAHGHRRCSDCGCRIACAIRASGGHCARSPPANRARRRWAFACPTTS